MICTGECHQNLPSSKFPTLPRTPDDIKRGRVRRSHECRSCGKARRADGYRLRRNEGFTTMPAQITARKVRRTRSRKAA